MKFYTVHCEYPALHRCEVTVERRIPSPPAGPPSALPITRMPGRAPTGSSRPTLRWCRGRTSIPEAARPRSADVSVLPVPGLFSDVTRLAGYAATRSEDLVLQLRIMLDAIDGDGGSRIDKHAMVRLCATGRAMLDDVERCGLPPKARCSAEGGAAPASVSPQAG